MVPGLESKGYKASIQIPKVWPLIHLFTCKSNNSDLLYCYFTIVNATKTDGIQNYCYIIVIVQNSISWDRSWQAI